MEFCLIDMVYNRYNRFKFKGVGLFKVNAFGGEPERAKMAAKPPIFASFYE